MADVDLLAAVRIQVMETLQRAGIAPDKAENAAVQLIEDLRQRYGGGRVLIPKLDRSKRDQEIMADWKEGRQPDEIAQRRNVDRATVYRVIGRARQQKRQDRGTGFGSDEWNL